MSNIDKKIKKDLLGKDIQMKPKSYFFAVSALYIISTILVILFALFLASFIFFATKSSGTNYLLAFGYSGILPYLQSLPWLLILALIILILLVEIFGKKIDLISKKPLIYSLAAVIIVIVGFGTVFANTEIHNSLFNRAVDNRLPFGKGLYEKYGTFHENKLIVAKIIESNDEYLVVESRGVEYQIEITEELHLPPKLELFVNQEIMIFGEIENNIIEAVGIRPFEGPKPKYKGSKSFYRIQQIKSKLNFI